MLVLIVDPNAKRQQQLRAVLASLGYRSSEVENCRDPDTGLALLRKKRYDICFFAAGGREAKFLESLREAASGAAPLLTPVVAMSATATREFVRAAVTNGAAAFLSSPFSVEAVEDALRQALARRGRQALTG